MHRLTTQSHVPITGETWDAARKALACASAELLNLMATTRGGATERVVMVRGLIDRSLAMLDSDEDNNQPQPGDATWAWQPGTDAILITYQSGATVLIQGDEALALEHQLDTCMTTAQQQFILGDYVDIAR